MKKRICAVILSLLLAVNLAGVPKAKAVVSETALLGSIFGSLLVSLGYSWAAENMDVPTFGESIYKLIQEHDEANKDTGVQLIRDLNIAALTSGRPGTIQFNYAWTQAARSFAEWFQEKYFSDGSISAVVSGNCYSGSVAYSAYSVSYPNYVVFSSAQSFSDGFSFSCDLPIDKSGNYVFFSSSSISSEAGLVLYNASISGVDAKVQTVEGGTKTIYIVTDEILANKPNLTVKLAFRWYGSSQVFVKGQSIPISSVNYFDYTDASALTAEKPVEVHYPDVAEDGSQVYEVTYQGVTATDIEGIIQGAVDQILAGTAAIAGEVTQVQDVPVEPEAPAAGEYAVPGLETIFPFCIPFDIYAFCSALNADPVAPSFEWRMQYAPLDLDYTFVIDLEAFDGAARVLRTMELLAFCVGLAFWTRHLIRG